MYIECVSIKALKHTALCCEVNEKRLTYYADLYQRYGKRCMTIPHKIYAYDFLVASLFSEIETTAFLNQAKWIFFVKSDYDFEGKYVSPELFVKYHYAFKANILDLRDCGSLGVYQGVKLVLDLRESALITALHSYEEEGRGVYYGFLGVSTKNTRFFIDSCHFLSSAQDLSVLKCLIDLIKCKKIKYSTLRFYVHQKFNFKFRDQFLFYVLSQAHQDDSTILVVDQDLFSGRICLVLVKVGCL